MIMCRVIIRLLECFLEGHIRSIFPRVFGKSLSKLYFSAQYLSCNMCGRRDIGSPNAWVRGLYRRGVYDTLIFGRYYNKCVRIYGIKPTVKCNKRAIQLKAYIIPRPDLQGHCIPVTLP